MQASAPPKADGNKGRLHGQRDATDAERAQLLRAAWDEGMESLRVHGPQLESGEEFEALMDKAEAEALR